MANTNYELDFDDFNLEPADPLGEEYSPDGSVNLQIDTRGGGDRRQSVDRRQTLRLDADRRQANRRATRALWEQDVDF